MFFGLLSKLCLSSSLCGVSFSFCLWLLLLDLCPCPQLLLLLFFCLLGGKSSKFCQEPGSEGSHAVVRPKVKLQAPLVLHLATLVKGH